MSRISARGAWLASALVAVAVLALVVPSRADSETASSTIRPVQAGYLDAGIQHTCAILADHTLRCWGKGLAGRLGHGSEATLLSAASSPPVNVGAGRTARAIAAGDFHTCAILDDRSVRCWGFGANGRLGYASTANVGVPASVPAVDLGPGRSAVAITAGASHTCAILDEGSVRCWGNGGQGRLGYASQSAVGDNETPGSVGPVNLGPGRTARAIAAGDFHTCAILDDGSLRCWGFGSSGQLGNGASANVGDDEAPATAGVVPLPAGRVARAVAGGAGHTCAILDDGSVRCWGFGANGRLGYGSTSSRSTPGGAVSIGLGRTATAIGAGDAHTCAILDTEAVRCWGFGGGGRLGYANNNSVGDTLLTTPNTAGPVNLGAGRVARALTLGGAPTPADPPLADEGTGYTCALLDDGTLRCWGYGGDGRLGYGDGQQVAGSGFPSPAAKGPVPLGPMAGYLGDLAVGLSAGATQLPLGGSTGLSVRTANGGPDAVATVLSIPAPPGVTYTSASASQGGFDAARGRWEVGALAPGAAASLQLAARVGAAGSHEVAAQMAASSIPDRAYEDDRAAVVLSVPAQAASGANRSLKSLPRRIGMKVVRFPRTGRVKRLIVSGVLALPRTRPATRCAGRVRVRALAGKRVVASTTTRLRRRAGACRYSAVLRPRRTRSARTVTVTARFLGSAQMRPRTSRSARVRIR
jgi:alpha-tubulin suppressor-like RCC1 family protein